MAPRGLSDLSPPLSDRRQPLVGGSDCDYRLSGLAKLAEGLEEKFKLIIRVVRQYRGSGFTHRCTQLGGVTFHCGRRNNSDLSSIGTVP